MKPVMIPGNLNAATAQRLYALEILRRCDGDRSKAAAALDVNPQTLRAWLTSLEEAGVAVPPARPGRPKNPKPRGAVRIVVPPKLALSA